MIERALFPDTSVAVDFAIVGRLDLLIGWLRGRGRFCDAVHMELVDWSREDPRFEVLINALGSPIELTEAEEDRAEQCRIVRFGGSKKDPLQHLGEAYTITLLSERRDEFAESTWLSDDKDSLGFAAERGIRAMDSIDILEDVVADGELTVDDAWGIWIEMWEHDKGGCRRPTAKSDLGR